MPLRVEAHTAVTSISDCGLELDAFSRAPYANSRSRLSELASRDSSAYELRRLERMLRPTRTDTAHLAPPLRFESPSINEPPDSVGEEVQIAASTLSSRHRSPPSRQSSGVSLLLVFGVTFLVSGMLLLVASNLLVHAAAWRWGFAVTIGSEGILLTGLAVLVTRLLKNSRRLNSQLDAVDRRLVELQSTLTQSPPSVTTASLRGAFRRLDSVGTASF